MESMNSGIIRAREVVTHVLGHKPIEEAHAMDHYTCPSCKGHKSYYASVCRSCRKKALAERNICPQCDGWKQAYSRQCINCYKAGALTTTTCSSCGGDMWRSRPGSICIDCYKRNGRLDAQHMSGDLTRLPLPHGEFALIDTEDFDRVRGYSWHTSGNGYVMAKIPGSGKTQLLHRFILGLTGDEVVDHRNHDPLDNTKANLFVGTQSENMHNVRPRPGKKYRGVYARHYAGVRTAAIRYVAKIHKDGKSVNLGSFDTEEEAAMAYDIAALELFGDRAVLNIESESAVTGDATIAPPPGK